MKNFYSILEVLENATHDEIKKSYRALAMKWHPDKNSGSKEAEEKFKQIGEAYEHLSDPGKRAFHDQELAHYRKAQEAAKKQQQQSHSKQSAGFNFNAKAWSPPPPRPNPFGAFTIFVLLFLGFVALAALFDSGPPKLKM